MNNNIAIYIHWPFCKSKCPYCDFNSHVRDKVQYEEWQQAYAKEINYFSNILEGKTISSIFFGGGTPSLMRPEIVATIINKFSKQLAGDVEITLEANPTSVEASKFKAFRDAGVNRLSLGIQSLNEQDLKFLGREHSATEAIQAIELTQELFPRYSFDLIYARPGQTLEAWQQELEQALTLAQDHLSLYQLTIEKGTPFFSAYQKQNFIMPDEELSADLYQLTEEIMKSHGFRSYEISNYAKPGAECKHNMTYWNYGDYLGIGPGAHSRLNHHAIMMLHSPEAWLKSVVENGAGIQQNYLISEQEILEELLLMGLRLTDGINIDSFVRHLNKTVYELVNFERLPGLVELNNGFLRATHQGRMVLNQVVKELV